MDSPPAQAFSPPPPRGWPFCWFARSPPPPPKMVDMTPLFPVCRWASTMQERGARGHFPQPWHGCPPVTCLIHFQPMGLEGLPGSAALPEVSRGPLADAGVSVGLASALPPALPPMSPPSNKASKGQWPLYCPPGPRPSRSRPFAEPRVTLKAGVGPCRAAQAPARQRARAGAEPDGDALLAEPLRSACAQLWPVPRAQAPFPSERGAPRRAGRGRARPTLSAARPSASRPPGRLATLFARDGAGGMEGGRTRLPGTLPRGAWRILRSPGRAAGKGELRSRRG